MGFGVGSLRHISTTKMDHLDLTTGAKAKAAGGSGPKGSIATILFKQGV